MKSLVLLFTLAIVAFGQAPRRDPYLIPPPGVVVAEADQRQLKAGLDRLAKRLLPLAGRPHLEDAQIFHKAVRYAVEGERSLRRTMCSRRRNCCGSATNGLRVRAGFRLVGHRNGAAGAGLCVEARW